MFPVSRKNPEKVCLKNMVPWYPIPSPKPTVPPFRLTAAGAPGFKVQGGAKVQECELPSKLPGLGTERTVVMWSPYPPKLTKLQKPWTMEAVNYDNLGKNSQKHIEVI